MWHCKRVEMVVVAGVVVAEEVVAVVVVEVVAVEVVVEVAGVVVVVSAGFNLGSLNRRSRAP